MARPLISSGGSGSEKVGRRKCKDVESPVYVNTRFNHCPWCGHRVNIEIFGTFYFTHSKNNSMNDKT